MQIILESPYNEYIAKLIENGEFQNAEQVVQFALNEKFHFDQWDHQTISLIKEGLKEVKGIEITEDYKIDVINAARKKSINNQPIPEHIKP